MKWHFSVTVWWTAIGAIVGAILCGVAFALAAGGHGTYLGYAVAFPWSELLYKMDLFHGENAWLTAIRWLQMPLYALLLSVLWHRSSRWRLWGPAILAVCHMLVIAACFLPDRFFPIPGW